MKRVQWWLRVGYVMDALRLWPRLFVGIYLLELTRVIEWYIANPTIHSWDIAAFVTAYATVACPLLKWYMENGVDWSFMVDKVWRHNGEKRSDPRCNSVAGAKE